MQAVFFGWTPGRRLRRLLTRSGPPIQRMDHMLRIIEFFERYAHNDSPAPTEQKPESKPAGVTEPRA